MKKQTEILQFNSNCNLIVSEGKIIGVAEMQQGIVNLLKPYKIDDYRLPPNYDTFTVIHLLATNFELQGY